MAPRHLILLFTLCAFFCNGEQFSQEKEPEIKDITLAASEKEVYSLKPTDYFIDEEDDIVEGEPLQDKSQSSSVETMEEKDGESEDNEEAKIVFVMNPLLEIKHKQADLFSDSEGFLEPTSNKEIGTEQLETVSSAEEANQKIQFDPHIGEELDWGQPVDQSNPELERNMLKIWENIKEFGDQYGLGSLNIFRLAGNMAHMIAVLILLFKILNTKFCDEISWKSQLLFVLVFITRYVDLFTDFISFYNSAFKIFFLISSHATLLLTLVKFKLSAAERKYDTFCIGLLVAPVALLALKLNYEFTVMEVLWTFSIYLESVAIVPQLYLLIKKGRMEKSTLLYLIVLGSYRSFYLCNWVYRYNTQYYYDPIAFSAGITQTCIYTLFFFHMFIIRRCCFVKREENIIYSENVGDKVPIIAYV